MRNWILGALGSGMREGRWLFGVPASLTAMLLVGLLGTGAAAAEPTSCPSVISGEEWGNGSYDPAVYSGCKAHHPTYTWAEVWWELQASTSALTGEVDVFVTFFETADAPNPDVTGSPVSLGATSTYTTAVGSCGSSYPDGATYADSVAFSESTTFCGYIKTESGLLTIQGTTQASPTDLFTNPIVQYYPLDTTPPTVELTSDASTPQSGLFTVTATFSEAVTGFAVGDVTVDNGSASNFAATSEAVYTFDVTPTADGAVTVDVAANVAADTAGNANTAATQLSVTADGTAPTVAITGPTDIVTEAFDVTITFSEPVYNFELADVSVVQGTATALTGSGDTYTATIDPVLGQTVKVSVAESMAADAAGNLNTASNEFAVSAGSPLSAFNTYTPQIRQAIVDDATRSLQSGLSSNRRMVQSARERFVEGQRERAACSEDDTGSGDDATCDPGLATRNSVPFDVDGTFALNGATLSTSGEFFEQTGNYEGTQRRLFFGDFDIQHDANTDSTTATITARVAWERLVAEQTMLGYFVGGELAHSTINGTFVGDQDRLGLTVGGYAVHQFQDDLFLDGFLTLGAGRNNLDMANDDLALTSDYNTRTATIGAALSGVYEYEQYEFRPELSFSYGKTWIGNVGFTGRAYERVDDTLSLDAGNVAIANLTLRPEIVWALDADTVADSNSQLSFAPRLICERRETVQSTDDCGGGAEIGLNSRSEDGLSNLEFRVIMDRVGDTTRSSFALNLERQF